ncbi:lysophospholipase [Lentinus tigrinus ALCF2SS1-7]|uniref:lysophospholipase n=1 Tax=Lentinus tigrinus ALCF2SS1-7 TaxID=1328758 RepID=UPI001165D36F|nr:lysophospholipase [Lentinus tigrinus ALCF2SS1-7]
MGHRLRVITLLSYLLALSSGISAQVAAAIAYAPTLEPCPAGTTLVREVAHTQTLSSHEADYVSGRRSHVLPRSWANYLRNVQASTRTSLPSYVDAILLGLYGKDALPTLGIATSGGGHRAAIFGAGVLNALDGRNKTSVHAGTGGLLQTATYLSGLSGGSWLVSSLAQANFPTLPDLVFGPANADGNGFGGWLTQIDLLQPGDATVTTAFVTELIEEIALKRTAGFPVTLADVWGRALSRHFVNGTTAANFFDVTIPHGAGTTLSSIANTSTFAAHAQPFPILVADSLTSRTTGQVVTEPGNAVPLTNPIYEFNIFEMGSFDPILGAFTPTKFLGSPGDSVCATGFDQLSFIEGVSSDLFNEFNTSAEALAASSVGPIIAALEVLFPQPGIRLDAAEIPNPFFGVSKATFPDSDQELLALVDGGEDGEVTPLQPLLVKARDVDTIIAIDAPADTPDNWTNGSSLIATENRVKLFPSTYSFPPVPSSANTFVARNLTRRPTFFGCDSPSSRGDPLVIYLANGGPPLGEPPLTNTSTNQLQYPPDEVQAMMDEVFDVATQGIPIRTHGGEVKDPLWPACLACAVVDRARRDAGISRSGICKACLERYCWS